MHVFAREQHGGRRWLTSVLVLLCVAGASQAPAADLALIGHVSVEASATSSEATIRIQQIANADNSGTSGDLRLLYQFFTSPYTGVAAPGRSGALLELAPLGAGLSYFDLQQTVPFAPAPAGTWCPAMILQERIGPTFTLRDFVTFPCREIGAVANTPPTASFTATPEIGPAPLTVNLDASGSSDSDGEITAIDWVTSDGQYATGLTTAITFDAPGLYSITLLVEDDQLGVTSVARSVLVSPPSDPCLQRVSIGTDTVISGNLSAADCAVGPFYRDYYEVVVPTIGLLTVGMSSQQLDPVVSVLSGDGQQVLASDDDGGVGSNALLDVHLAAGTYVIAALSAGEGQIGSYGLRTAFVPEPGVALMQGAALLVMGGIAAMRRKSGLRARR